MSAFMQKAREWLIGTPESREPIDPASIHISQVGDELYNSGAQNATANCGPVAVIMAIRLLGLPVPGEERYRGEDLVEYVRVMATGRNERMTGTNNMHLQRVLARAGAAWRNLTHPKDMLQAVRNGQPVIMAGNPAVPTTYTRRFDYFDIRRWDGGHWILVSRYNPERRTFTVNDPQSVIGPVEVSAEELYAFNSRNGNFGIAVRRA
jgi:Peptidase_C39 like family